MDERQRRIQRTLKDRQSAPIPLHVAASLAYFDARRASPRIDDRQLERALNDAAFALAQIADIYHENEAHHVLRIPDEDLGHGTFRNGGQLFACSDGRMLRRLSMRRIDVMYALEVLRQARRTLDKAGEETQIADPGDAAGKPD